MIVCGRYQFLANEDTAEKPQCNFDICGKFVHVASYLCQSYFAYVTFLPGDEVEASEKVGKKLQISSATSDGMCLISNLLVCRTQFAIVMRYSIVSQLRISWSMNQ